MVSNDWEQLGNYVPKPLRQVIQNQRKSVIGALQWQSLLILDNILGPFWYVYVVIAENFKIDDPYNFLWKICVYRCLMHVVTLRASSLMFFMISASILETKIAKATAVASYRAAHWIYTYIYIINNPPTLQVLQAFNKRSAGRAEPFKSGRATRYEGRCAPFWRGVSEAKWH